MHWSLKLPSEQSCGQYHQPPPLGGNVMFNPPWGYVQKSFRGVEEVETKLEITEQLVWAEILGPNNGFR